MALLLFRRETEMNASGQEPAPAPQPAHVHAAPARDPDAAKPHAPGVVDAPHEDHASDEPGYGHGV